MARCKAVGLKRREMACETQKNHRTGETSDGSAGSVLRQTVGRGAEALKDKEEGESGLQMPARPGAGVFIRESEVVKDKYYTRKMS